MFLRGILTIVGGVFIVKVIIMLFKALNHEFNEATSAVFGAAIGLIAKGIVYIISFKWLVDIVNAIRER